MKRLRLALSVFAAIVGIGGAFASQAKVQESSANANPVLKWYTVGGHFITVGTINQVKVKGYCVPGAVQTCLKGTTGTILHQRKGTILGTFQA
jgi:hypothetical protein